MFTEKVSTRFQGFRPRGERRTDDEGIFSSPPWYGDNSCAAEDMNEAHTAPLPILRRSKRAWSETNVSMLGAQCVLHPLHVYLVAPGHFPEFRTFVLGGRISARVTREIVDPVLRSQAPRRAAHTRRGHGIVVSVVRRLVSVVGESRGSLDGSEALSIGSMSRCDSAIDGLPIQIACEAPSCPWEGRGYSAWPYIDSPRRDRAATIY